MFQPAPVRIEDPIVLLQNALTGFSSDEREVLKEWVLQLGLQYSGDLVCRHSTHLVCKDLFRAFYGPKYVKALHWGVHIVSFRWIYDSLQAGQLLLTAAYKADEPGPADVALHQAVSLRARIAALQEASRVPLGELCINSQDEALHDGKAADLLQHANKPKKRPAGCVQEDDFSFDLPSRGSDQDCSPRLCQAVSTAQPKPIAVGDSSDRQPFAAVENGLQAGAEVRAQQADTVQPEADSAEDLNLSSPSCKQPELPTQLPTPSTIEVSFSELNAEVTITVPADDASPQREGMDKTPISVEIYKEANVTSRSAEQPTRLGMPPDFTAPSGLGATVIADDTCPQERATGGRDLHMQASATWCAAEAEAEASHGSVNLEDAPSQLVAVQPLPQATVLYSGFDVPFAAIATVTKGRRLVRTDRWSAAEELPSCAHLEDDLEDDIEDPPSHTTAAPALVSAFDRAAADCRRAAQSSLPVALQRPPLASNASLEENPASVIERKGSGPRRFLHKPVPGISAAAPTGFTDCSSRSQLLSRQEHQQKQAMSSLQQEGQLGPRLDQRSSQRTSGSGPSVSIKAEPGCGDDKTGHLGPVIAQAQGAAAAGIGGDRGVAVTQPSARRRAAVLGTSLLSEPETIAPLPLARKTTAAPAGAPRRTCSEPERLSDGYDSASSSHGTSSGLDDLDFRPSPSPDAGAGPGSRAGPQHRTARKDGAQADEGQEGSIRRKKIISKTTGVNASSDSSKTGVVPRPEKTSSDEGSSIDATTDAPSPPRIGLGQVRNAAAVKPLPRATGAKANPHGGSGNTETAATIDPYVSQDQDCDVGIVSRTEAVSQLTVSLSQSTSLQLEDGSSLNKWPREPLTDTKSIEEYLRLNVLMAEEYLAKEWPSAAGGLSSDSHVRIVKAMGRPKASTLALRHPGVSLKTVQFAEQILVEPLKLLLNCRDKSKRARCPLITLVHDGDVAEVSTRREIFLAEPCNIYRLPSGDWWLEYYRYFSFNDVTVLATAAGRPVKMPNDYDNWRELMRDTEPSHCRVNQVRGNMVIVRTRKVPPCERGRPAGSGRPAFCRFLYDKDTGTPITVQQAAELIID
ncbi:hypothetical protein Vretifemale_508 [Volvox reticuliferus]|uniref:BRCT domain-containing protein n=1 Tax=Volvox reticuliferus TaxID=1737510 RepID=A0A8J4BVZ5_9CHLO|nr:hypothetical protein Vretifemale_508 [Volvox reticuliferus]